MTGEALARKQRSIEILRSEGVPYVDHLPVIETEAESIRRSSEEVALRAIALCVVAVKGVGAPPELTNRMLEKLSIWPSLTPKESVFVKKSNAPPEELATYSWRFESFWTLMWALGFIESLERPERQCDSDKAGIILRDLGRDRFLAEALLRPQTELLDAADLVYRYHWAIRSAALSGKDWPAGLDGEVVAERHHALNWLVGPEVVDWDDVSTDT